jgi:hypothetical protein
MCKTGEEMRDAAEVMRESAVLGLFAAVNLLP